MLHMHRSEPELAPRRALTVLGWALLLLGLPLALMACEKKAMPGELPGAASEVAKLGRALRCSRPLYCDNMGYLDCNTEEDGPGYFFDRSTGKVISACGFGVGNAKTCPPPAWSCSYPSGKRGT